MISWLPDVDPATKGALSDVDNMTPTVRGYAGEKAAANAGFTALGSECRGAVAVRKLDDSSRFFATTQTAIYEGSSGTYTDRSKGGGYTGGGETIWRFAQFGDVTIACNKVDATQFSTTAAFADLSGAPKSSIVETVGNFVFLFDTDEGTYGDCPNRWWCAGIGTYTVWTPDIATQCATGLLEEIPGKVKAAKRLGQRIIAYKERGMYVGTYTGPDFIWSFNAIPGDVGAVNQESVVSTGTDHFFMGFYDFWVFDGIRPISLTTSNGSTSVKEWFFSDASYSLLYKVKARHDVSKSTIYWHYASTASTSELDKWIAYNYKTGRWGKGTLTVEFPVEYLTPAITYDTIGNFYATWDDLPAIAYDSPFWVAQSPVQAIYKSDHILYTLGGVSSSCSMTTNDIGSNDKYWLVRQVKPRYKDRPTTGTLTPYTFVTEGDTPTAGTDVTEANGRYDLLQSSTWHKFKLTFTGDVEIIDLEPDIVPDGEV